MRFKIVKSQCAQHRQVALCVRESPQPFTNHPEHQRVYTHGHTHTHTSCLCSSFSSKVSTLSRRSSLSTASLAASSLAPATACRASSSLLADALASSARAAFAVASRSFVAGSTCAPRASGKRVREGRDGGVRGLQRSCVPVVVWARGEGLGLLSCCTLVLVVLILVVTAVDCVVQGKQHDTERLRKLWLSGVLSQNKDNTDPRRNKR